MPDKLSDKNLLHRDKIIRGLVDFNKALEGGLNFKLIEKKANPKYFFEALVLKKLYVINISAENSLLANDVFLSVYLYRYIYELYIKVAYIYSSKNDAELLVRIENFFSGIDLRVDKYIKGIDTSKFNAAFIDDHNEKYKLMSQIAHPNVESFNLHIGKTSNVHFDFIVPNIILSFFLIKEIIDLFIKNGDLDLKNSINAKDLETAFNLIRGDIMK